ncbi:Predicted arabinose efflux permease, MFS family [Colwellia chukchiensis]|uniref:Predicted arabinose efflux permease, MFS family n=1 Tax=Colwellia chukchiensis TaxID=641665 RepID=A0A1H7NTV2_9GAMM|nr:MFS transporter [Colwellia chukchiensis]SEL26458.1 Predicted arabinose efflux permease, MFS family [Colwellia chukchiensis]
MNHTPKRTAVASNDALTERSQAKKTLFSVMLVVLFSSAGIALPYPILAPLFLNEISPLTTFAHLPSKILLGIILATYPLGVIIGSSVLGAASGVYGRKKVLILTLVLTALSYVLSALAVIAENFLLLAIARFVTGVFAGNISIAKAIAVDLSPKLDKTYTFNLVNATGYLGWLLGPLAGGLLASYGLDTVFFFAAATLFIALISVLTFLPFDEKAWSQEQIKFRQLFSSQNSFALLSNSKIRRIFSIYLLATLGLNAYYEFYPVWLVERFAFSSAAIGYITVLLTLFMIFTSVFMVKKLNYLLGLKNGATLGMVLMALLFVIHPLLSSSTIWPVYGAIGVAIAIFNGLLPVYISEQYADIEQGQLMGLITTVFSLASVIMALVGSALALFGAHWAIIFGALLLFIAAIDFSYSQHSKH